MAEETEPDRLTAADRLRMQRHEDLLTFYHARDLPAEEILADVGILVQLAAFKVRKEREHQERAT